MKLLSLETATAAGASALVVDAMVVGEAITTIDRLHTETLLPSAIALLAAAGLTPQELDGIVVDVGPGLFTGLRVGIATARSLAFAAELPVYCVTSLSMLANDPSVGGIERVVAVVDARRGEVFTQEFQRSENGVPIATSEPAVLVPADVRGLLEHRTTTVTLVGDGVTRYEELFAGIDGVTLGTVTTPSPAVAAQIVERDEVEGVIPSAVTPLYLRDPDAVANFTVATGRGSP
jgi:tRNA threonylcarbamoyladenosine biosynthesis protein TsaB